MSITTRRLTRRASSAPAWHANSVCRQTDPEAFFQDDNASQAQAQGVCRGCPVIASCLDDVLAFEESREGRYGVVGGLTPIQRRALRVEALLGNRPHLTQARLLASPTWAGFMHGMRDWPADIVAGELLKLGVMAAPVTVRVASWWSGGKGVILSPKPASDTRYLWERVRDEARPVVLRLREMGVSNRDIAAYVGVSEDGLGKAVTAWNQAAKAVAA